jgi:hypothetical protein
VSGGTRYAGDVVLAHASSQSGLAQLSCDVVHERPGSLSSTIPGPLSCRHDYSLRMRADVALHRPLIEVDHQGIGVGS